MRSHSMRGASRQTLRELRRRPCHFTWTDATEGALTISSTSKAKRHIRCRSKTGRINAMLKSLKPHCESSTPAPEIKLNSHERMRRQKGRVSLPPLRLPHTIAFSHNGAKAANSVRGADSSTSLISTQSPFAASAPFLTLYPFPRFLSLRSNLTGKPFRDSRPKFAISTG